MLSRSRSLLTKFLVLVVPIVVLCSVAASGLSTYLNAQDLQRQLGQEMMNVVATEGVALALPLWNYRSDNTQSIVDAILVNPNISGVRVTDNFNTVIAEGGTLAAGDGRWAITTPILSPVAGDAAYIGRLFLTYNDHQIRRTVRERLLSDASLVAALILALSLGAAVAHAVAIGRPLTRFVRAIRRAEDPTLRQPVPVTARDEIGDIMAAYNRLLHRLGEEEEERRRANDALRVERDRAEDALRHLKAAQDSLIQAEKLAALGGLVAGMAHEMNTPIGNALVAASFVVDQTVAMEATLADGKLRAQALRDYLAATRETVGHVVDSCDRAAGLVRSFKMVAADPGEQDRSTVPLSAVIDMALAPFPERTAARHPIHAEVIGADGTDGDAVIGNPVIGNAVIDSYPSLLAEVLTALLRNATTHAYPNGAEGAVRLTARAEADRVVFEVADDGCGIDPDALPRIFDPFFTTDRRIGSGIGLHFVHNALARTLNGRIVVETAVGRGSCFRLTLPRRLDQPLA